VVPVGALELELNGLGQNRSSFQELYHRHAPPHGVADQFPTHRIADTFQCAHLLYDRHSFQIMKRQA
jgi:hypothetical protein